MAGVLLVYRQSGRAQRVYTCQHPPTVQIEVNRPNTSNRTKRTREEGVIAAVDILWRAGPRQMRSEDKLVVETGIREPVADLTLTVSLSQTRKCRRDRLLGGGAR